MSLTESSHVHVASSTGCNLQHKSAGDVTTSCTAEAAEPRVIKVHSRIQNRKHREIFSAARLQQMACVSWHSTAGSGNVKPGSRASKKNLNMHCVC